MATVTDAYKNSFHDSKPTAVGYQQRTRSQMRIGVSFSLWWAHCPCQLNSVLFQLCGDLYVSAKVEVLYNNLLILPLSCFVLVWETKQIALL